MEETNTISQCARVSMTRPKSSTTLTTGPGRWWCRSAEELPVSQQQQRHQQQQQQQHPSITAIVLTKSTSLLPKMSKTIWIYSLSFLLIWEYIWKYFWYKLAILNKSALCHLVTLTRRQIVLEPFPYVRIPLQYITHDLLEDHFLSSLTANLGIYSKIFLR